MSSVVDYHVNLTPGPIRPIEKASPIDANNPRAPTPKGVENRLADRLALSDCRISQVLGHGKRILGDSSKTASCTHRLPQAWSVLTELVETKKPENVDERLSMLLSCLSLIGQPPTHPRPAVRDYSAWLQLYSMLPIYLRLEKCDFQEALDESLFFAYQSISLIDLDQTLEGEMFELLSESPFLNQAPSVALQNALNVDLVKLVDALGGLVEQRRAELATHARPSSDRCEGYWSIVRQWTGGATHLRIPTKLSIGKILWPKVREHWSRLSQAMLEVQGGPEATQQADDFVEIRNSNDPHLAATLDIQLQRCRDQQGTMSLVVIKVLGPSDTSANRTSDHRLPQWQESVIEQLRVASDGQAARGYICESGELTLIVDDLDRNQLSGIVREIIELASQPHDAASSMVEIPRLPIVGGIACVASPSKHFQIDQLIRSAWRCLDAAQLQGPGTVKSIEVF